MSGMRPRRGVAAADERFDLRHAEVRVQPRRAAAARTDADLDAVDAALGEEVHAFRRRHITGNELGVAELLAGTPRSRGAITDECPCAMSMTMTSAPARSSSAARSR